jgi:hypothetical protein
VRVTEVTGSGTRTVTVGRVVSTALEVAHVGGAAGESQGIAALVPSGGRGTLLFALRGVLWAAYE